MGGVMSKVAMIMLALIFAGVVNMNTAMPNMFALRAVFYRYKTICIP